jgi:uncharacterized protein YegL
MASYQSFASYINPNHIILDNLKLEFHTNTEKNAIPNEVIKNMDLKTDNTESNESFGCLEIQAGETTINIDPVFFLFMIDESGSMSEMCKDGKTKMDHVHYTMNQILFYFAENPETTIYVNVSTFDDKVRTVIDTTMITHNNVNEIMEKIKKIRPQNSTNLELALKTANQIMDDYVTTVSKKNQQHRIVHILLTDGCPTEGDSNEINLSNIINDSYSNTFIAFGVDHNPILMNKLGNAGKNTSNYTIEKLELIGNVYGEVVYNQLYKVMDNVILNIDEGYIYDWYTNEWKTTLYIGSLSNETKKYYYIKSSVPDNCSVEITGRPIDRDAGILFKDYTKKTSNETCDISYLTKHMLRLCTQRLLYEARVFAESEKIEDNIFRFQTQDYDNLISPSDSTEDTLPILLKNTSTSLDNKTKLEILKEKINEFLKYMRNYLNTTEKNDFIEKLCEDMEIAIKTLGTKVQDLYLNARSKSQGTQQMYNVTLDDDIVNDSAKINNTYTTPIALKLMRDFSAR